MQIKFEYTIGSARGTTQLRGQVHMVEVGNFPPGKDYPSYQQLLSADQSFMQWFSRLLKNPLTPLDSL